jgi:hypothetical protein
MPVSANGVPRVDIHQPVKQGLCQDAHAPKGLRPSRTAYLRQRFPFYLVRRLCYNATMVDLTPITQARTDFLALYRQAFEAFGASALWNKARIENPSPEHALVIARALRIEGDKRARQLAEDIEQAVRAAPRAAE